MQRQRAAAMMECPMPVVRPRRALDRLAWLAAQICAAPAAIASAMDHDRKWHRGFHGAGAHAICGDASLYAHVIADGKAWVADDLRLDTRFAGSPLVTGDAAVRACAIQPVRRADGAIVGACGVFDLEPRSFSDTQVAALQAIAQQAAETIESYRVNEELATLHRREAAYHALLSETHEQELRRLADVLHEGVSQEISGASLLVAAAAHRAKGADPELAGNLREIAGLLSQTIGTCRVMAEAHDGFALTQSGLSYALAVFIGRLGIAAPRRCEFEGVPLSAGALDDGTAFQLLKIGQEAIRNAVQHSDGRRIRVSLAEAGGEIVLTVTDDGAQRERTQNGQRGIGQAIMRHRALAIGAHLSFGYIQGRGYRVCCEVPTTRINGSSGGYDPLIAKSA